MARSHENEDRTGEERLSQPSPVAFALANRLLIVDQRRAVRIAEFSALLGEEKSIPPQSVFSDKRDMASRIDRVLIVSQNTKLANTIMQERSYRRGAFSVEKDYLPKVPLQISPDEQPQVARVLAEEMNDFFYHISAQ